MFVLSDQTGVSMKHGETIVTEIENKLSLNPVLIRILEVLKTRSRISKPTFITLTCAKCLLMVWCPSSSDVSRRVSVVIVKEITKGFRQLF